MTKSRKPLYQPWNEDEFSGDPFVVQMTPVQRWIYRTLLQRAFYCSTRPYLPMDDEMLCALAGCESMQQWTDNRDVVMRRFTVTSDGMLANNRVLEDWNRIEDARTKMSEMGKKSASIRNTFYQGCASSGHESGELPNGSSTYVERELNEGSTREVKEKNKGKSKAKSEEKESSEREVQELPYDHGESEMKLIEEVRQTALRYFKARAEDRRSYVWKDLVDLAGAFPDEHMPSLFEEWAKNNQHREMYGKPVAAFVKELPDILAGNSPSVMTEPSKNLIAEFTGRAFKISGLDTVTFTGRYQMLVCKALEEYGVDRVVAAYEHFYRHLPDDFARKNAAKTFAETLDQQIQILTLHGRSEEEKARQLDEAKKQAMEQYERDRESRVTEEFQAEL